MPSLRLDFENFMGNTVFTVFFYALVVYLICVVIRIGTLFYLNYRYRRFYPNPYFLEILELISGVLYLVLVVAGLIIIYRAFKLRCHILNK